MKFDPPSLVWLAKCIKVCPVHVLNSKFQLSLYMQARKQPNNDDDAFMDHKDRPVYPFAHEMVIVVKK